MLSEVKGARKSTGEFDIAFPALCIRVDTNPFNQGTDKLHRL